MKKNVILMAMSAGLDKTRDDTFVLDETITDKLKIRRIEHCVSQLEPVTRMMLENDTESGVEIIMLSTEKTRCAKAEMDLTKEADYFAERIRENESATGFSHIRLNEDGSVKLYELDKTGFGRSVRFFDIQIKERDPMFGLGRAVGVIRQIKEAEGMNQFWIAANGGLRDSYLTIAAIISLLQTEEIVPDYILSTEFNRTVREQIIYDAMPSFKMFGFVSALNEFNRIGSADALKDYFISVGVDKNDKLIDAMRRVSLGNSLCNTLIYEQGLTMLRKRLGGMPGDSTPDTKSRQACPPECPPAALSSVADDKSGVNSRDEFVIFKDAIRQDYGVILETEGLYIDVVERCLKKKMYQQVLTFIESKMCEDYFEKRVLYFDENKASGAMEKLKKKLDRPQNEDGKHLVLDHYLAQGHWLLKGADYHVRIMKYSERENHKRNRIINTALEFLKHMEAFNTFLHMENRDCMKGCLIARDFFTGSRTIEFDGITIDILTCVSGDFQKSLAGYLMRMHKLIKGIRNMINHGNWDVMSTIITEYNKNVPKQERLSDHEGIIFVLESLTDMYIKMSKKLFETIDEAGEQEKGE